MDAPTARANKVLARPASLVPPLIHSMGWAGLGWAACKRAAFGADTNAVGYVPSYWVLCHLFGTL